MQAKAPQVASWLICVLYRNTTHIYRYIFTKTVLDEYSYISKVIAIFSGSQWSKPIAIAT